MTASKYVRPQDFAGCGGLFCCSGAKNTATGKPRARRRRTPGPLELFGVDFLELVRGAWAEGAEQADPVERELPVDAVDGGLFEEDCVPPDAICAGTLTGKEQSEAPLDDAGQAAPEVSAGMAVELDCAAGGGFQHQPNSGDIPEGISEALRACSIGCPAPLAGDPLLAGLPLPDFWRQLQRLSRREDPMKPFERMLQFRSTYRWPLTIRAGNVARALDSGMLQYLPPQAPRGHPLLTCALCKMDMQRCAMEEYQMLAMFMLEAAFRSMVEDHCGLIVVVDLRGISSSLARLVFMNFADLSRAIAMCSGSMPSCVAHVLLIEGPATSRFLKATLAMILSSLSGKVMSRIRRGGVDAAAEFIGVRALPQWLGGDRDADGEWLRWLEAWRVQEVTLGLEPKSA